MAREPKTPKAVIQLLLATAGESTKPAAAPDAIIDHEQIRRREQFEAIAKGRNVAALSTMWRTLLEGMGAHEFERSRESPFARCAKCPIGRDNAALVPAESLTKKKADR